MKRAIQIGVVLAIIAIAVLAVIKIRAGGSATKPEYRVATVELGTLRKTVSATGTLQPWTTVDIKSKAGGRVDELAVDVGSVVKAGQIIAKIDPTDSLLTYNQAKADIDSAHAKESQSTGSYRMQVSLSQSSIMQAAAALNVARANLAAMAARLQTAKDQDEAQPIQTAATVAQAQANYDSMVQQRAQLTQTQIQERASARAAYAQAAANDKNAQANLARMKSLYPQGFIAAADLDAAIAAAGVSAAALAVAKETLNTLAMEQKNVVDSTDAKVRQALEALKAAKAQIDVQSRHNALREAKAAYDQAYAQVQQSAASLAAAKANAASDQIKALDIASAKAGTFRADAALTNAKSTLEQTVVRSPSEGVVLHKYVEQGTIITSGLSMTSAGTSIVQIGDVTRMFVYVLVDETDIGSVRVGQDVNVTVDAYADMRFRGKVSRVDPEAQVLQNVTSVGVRVEIDNSERGFKFLKPSMNATCEFVVAQKDRVLSVPTDAIQTDAEGAFVNVVDTPASAKTSNNGRRAGKAGTETLTDVKYKRRSVEIGFEGDEATEILSGLKPGERVVVQIITPNATGTSRSASSSRSPFGGRGPGGGMGPPPGGP